MTLTEGEGRKDRTAKPVMLLLLLLLLLLTPPTNTDL